MATVVNEANEVLLLWRHRFITDSWGWELAGGVVEDGEDIAYAAAARELEEETGWRPGPLRHLMSVEPSNGLTDARHHIYWSDDGGRTSDTPWTTSSRTAGSGSRSSSSPTWSPAARSRPPTWRPRCCCCTICRLGQDALP